MRVSEAAAVSAFLIEYADEIDDRIAALKEPLERFDSFLVRGPIRLPLRYDASRC